MMTVSTPKCFNTRLEVVGRAVGAMKVSSLVAFTTPKASNSP
jgi:hypothetical protein